jgi:hypothetical protein
MFRGSRAAPLEIPAKPKLTPGKPEIPPQQFQWLGKLFHGCETFAAPLRLAAMERGVRAERLNGQVATPQRGALRPIAPIPVEVAIGIAYGFARSLRGRGSGDGDFKRLSVEWVDRRFAGTPLLAHIRAGFAAGFCGASLPAAATFESAEP